MIPTYVQKIPDGSETGTFLALVSLSSRVHHDVGSRAQGSVLLMQDLGGTNLRVCEVTLLGDHKWTMKQQKYKVRSVKLYPLLRGELTHLLL